MPTRTILILGGSYIGISNAHYTLKHIIPSLPNSQEYQVVLVSPSNEIIVRPATPRALLSDDTLDQKRLFQPLVKQFEQYPKENFTFIQGLAKNLDHANRVVTVELAAGEGSSAESNLEDYGKTYATRQWSYETDSPVDVASFGPATSTPLGRVALGRSGDKASDANVGFFVRNDDEWHWLRSYLTVAKIKEPLGPEYNGKSVDRFEIPGIRAVHFQLHDHLDRGWGATSTYDGLGKNVCEYLRAKHVELPNIFLEKGQLSHQGRLYS